MVSTLPGVGKSSTNPKQDTLYKVGYKVFFIAFRESFDIRLLPAELRSYGYGCLLYVIVG